MLLTRGEAAGEREQKLLLTVYEAVTWWRRSGGSRRGLLLLAMTCRAMLWGGLRSRMGWRGSKGVRVAGNGLLS